MSLTDNNRHLHGFAPTVRTLRLRVGNLVLTKGWELMEEEGASKWATLRGSGRFLGRDTITIIGTSRKPVNKMRVAIHRIHIVPNWRQIGKLTRLTN